MARKRTAAVVLEIPVLYGNLNIGDETARLGIRVDRKKLKLTDADRHLCGKRLKGTIEADAGNANPEQPAIFQAGVSVTAVFDVNGFGVTRKAITTGLTVKLGSMNIEDLAHFAKRAGRFLVESIGDIPEEEKAAAGTADKDEEE